MKRLNRTMMYIEISLCVAAAVTILPAGGWGQSTPPSASPPPYRIDMGEAMAFSVQPRHVKIAIAARANDWAYAFYASKELGESFDRISRAIPTYRRQATADLFVQHVKEPLTEMTEAIKAADSDRFKIAYTALTRGCNDCHQETNHAMIVIKAPDSADLNSDHDFRSSKP
jgi:hypothetical protein